MARIRIKSDDLARVRRVSSWDELMRYESEFGAKGRWVFRGHRDANWELESTLERAIHRFVPRNRDPILLESGLIRQFARRAHHHMPDPPAQTEWLEWLALMQHHGAPTRLIDFTYSFYIALFFALEELEIGGRAALWAIDVKWVDEQLRHAIDLETYQRFYEIDRNVQERDLYGKLFAGAKPMAFFINPYRLNQRLSLQQGIFLCPGDISRSTVENLNALGPAKWGIQKIEIRLNVSEFKKCIQRLIRMNMSRTTLFPGLDGFAMSQKFQLANPTVLAGDPTYPIRASSVRARR